jgi:hypothetical protein
MLAPPPPPPPPLLLREVAAVLDVPEVEVLAVVEDVDAVVVAVEDEAAFVAVVVDGFNSVEPELAEEIPPINITLPSSSLSCLSTVTVF